VFGSYDVVITAAAASRVRYQVHPGRTKTTAGVLVVLPVRSRYTRRIPGSTTRSTTTTTW